MPSIRAINGFFRDSKGSVALEFAIVSTVFIGLLLGIVEFGYAFWQWNAAAKAVQLGARRAAVSNPVSSDLATMTGLSATVQPGDPMPYYERVCSGQTQTCTNGTYDAAAMNAILYGPGNATCPTAPQASPAMCQISNKIKVENIVVEYVHTGLGFSGRPGGPVPTITVRLVGMTFDFIVIGKLFGLSTIQMPALATTVTAEDLSNAGS